MSEDGIAALRRALLEPPGRHLDDEMLATIATAEVAGEAVEQVYAEQLDHMERCVQCAEAYSALFTLLEETLGEMAAAAEAAAGVDASAPEEAFARLLQGEVALPVDAPAGLLRRVVAALPAAFNTLPDEPDEVTPEAVLAILQETAPQHVAGLVQPLTNAIRRQLPALGLYLKRAAAAVWGQPVRVSTADDPAGVVLRFASTPRAAVPVLAVREQGPVWNLASRPGGRPPQNRIDIWAESTSPVACRLFVRVDRPGLHRPAGRAVQIRYAGREQEAVTDDRGTAVFDDVPIATVPQIIIRVGDEAA